MNTQQKAAAIESKVREVCGDDLDGCGGRGMIPHEFSCQGGKKEIHLGHILQIVGSDYGVNGDGVFLQWHNQRFLGYVSTEIKYDLTKSFSQNLEDEDLCNYLYKLICE